MDRLKELELRREEVLRELARIKEEMEDLELGNLSLPGKYLYSKERGYYIHVTGTRWLSYEGERTLYLEGETLWFSEDEDDGTTFEWSLNGELKTVLRNFEGDWEEIDENQWREAKKTALGILKKYYNV